MLGSITWQRQRQSFGTFHKLTVLTDWLTSLTPLGPKKLPGEAEVKLLYGVDGASSGRSGAGAGRGRRARGAPLADPASPTQINTHISRKEEARGRRG